MFGPGICSGELGYFKHAGDDLRKHDKRNTAIFLPETSKRSKEERQEAERTKVPCIKAAKF